MNIFFRNKPYTQKDVVYQFAKLFSFHFAHFNYRVRVTDENLASSFKVAFLMPDWIGTFVHMCCEVFSSVFWDTFWQFSLSRLLIRFLVFMKKIMDC